jgi:hypothetical protein
MIPQIPAETLAENPLFSGVSAVINAPGVGKRYDLH